MEDIKRMEKKTDEKCDLCGSPLLLKWGKFGSFYACSAYNKKDPTSCTFTKENTAAKPDLNTPEAQEAGEQEEYCENCGKVMVLRRGPFGMFMACPDYNADPPCKTIPQAEPEAAAEAARRSRRAKIARMCGKPLVLRQGAYGEFVSCSGYPKCKYVKQNLIEGMKCPKCGDGRPGGAQGAARECLLGLHQLSQVRLHFELQAGGEEVPGVRKPVPGGEDAASRESTWSARTRRRAPKKRLHRRRRGKKARRCGGAAARWCAATRSASAMRRLRRRRRRTGRCRRSKERSRNCSRRRIIAPGFKRGQVWRQHVEHFWGRWWAPARCSA